MTRWYLEGIAAAIAIGWVAALCHSHAVAPLGIISIAVGAVLGACLYILAVMQRVAGSRQLFIGAILLATLTVLIQHAWLYHDFRQKWHVAQAANPQVAMFRPGEPWSPREYFARETTAGRIALWTVDATLIVVTATSVVVLTQRRKSPTSDT